MSLSYTPSLKMNISSSTWRILMRSCIEKPTPRVEQGVGSGAVGATPAELVRGGLMNLTLFLLCYLL